LLFEKGVLLFEKGVLLFEKGVLLFEKGFCSLERVFCRLKRAFPREYSVIELVSPLNIYSLFNRSKLTASLTCWVKRSLGYISISLTKLMNLICTNELT
jgi:hypothetical protein